jgi:capsular polysaccharide transport system ATP-binding protein
VIELRKLTKSYRTTSGRKYIFRDLSMIIPPDVSIGLIGRNGAGKSTLLRLIGGIDTPDRGAVITDKSISWPVGLSGGFQGSMTGRDNVKFVSRVYGDKGEELREKIRFVQAFAEIGDYFDQPVKTYSSGMKSRLAFGLSMAFDFDYYLIDEVMSTGDAHFKKKAMQMFDEKIGKAHIILTTHNMAEVRRLCQIVLLVSQGGRVTVFDDVEAGILAYQNGAVPPAGGPATTSTSSPASGKTS